MVVVSPFLSYTGDCSPAAVGEDFVKVILFLWSFTEGSSFYGLSVCLCWAQRLRQSPNSAVMEEWRQSVYLPVC